MVEPVIPVGKCMHICDDVFVSPDRVLTLVRSRDTFVGRHPGSPFRVPRVEVVASLAGGFGEMPFRILIVDPATDTLLFTSAEARVVFPTRQIVLHVPFRLTDCPFPRQGTYFVELWCGTRFIDDRRILVIVPPREIP